MNTKKKLFELIEEKTKRILEFQEIKERNAYNALFLKSNKELINFINAYQEIDELKNQIINALTDFIEEQEYDTFNIKNVGVFDNRKGK